MNMKYSQITRRNINKIMLNKQSSLWRHLFIIVP